ncbi:MAG: hypothetical protein WCD70_10430 [Alphaproteobacteria bacterium]
MQYEELHRRYGLLVSQRLRRELTPSEFNQIDIELLPAWLEARAESAHEEYRRLQNNPLAADQIDAARIGNACRHWRESEDLAYLVAIAEDVSLNAKAS